ncbi:MAG: type II toxin-antitoxin system HigB family toxin [Prosthecobacter sp.]|nr:type II toxin-antitoxin system HigB family toxin [Prosthecobacter sp.]
MKLVGRETLNTFAKRHANSLKPLQSWVRIVEAAEWKSFQEIKNNIRSADVLSGNRVIFDIKGNDYRLVALVRYRQGVMEILWIGTHAEYSKKKWN